MTMTIKSTMHHAAPAIPFITADILIGWHLTGTAEFIHTFRIILYRRGMRKYMTIPFKVMIHNGCVNWMNMLDNIFCTAMNTFMPCRMYDLLWTSAISSMIKVHLYTPFL